MQRYREKDRGRFALACPQDWKWSSGDLSLVFIWDDGATGRGLIFYTMVIHHHHLFCNLPPWKQRYAKAAEIHQNGKSKTATEASVVLIKSIGSESVATITFKGRKKPGPSWADVNLFSTLFLLVGWNKDLQSETKLSYRKYSCFSWIWLSF